MCLAVPGKVVERRGDDAVIDMHGNRLSASLVMTPDANVGDWVLVHAGFAITQLDAAEALETWQYLREAGVDLGELSDGDSSVSGPGRSQLGEGGEP